MKHIHLQKHAVLYEEQINKKGNLMFSQEMDVNDLVQKTV